MKNQHPHPLVANLPPCCQFLMWQARRLPAHRLPRRPAWWFRLQFTRLLNGGLPADENVQSVIGLPAHLPETERDAYNVFLNTCRRRGLTEEQILLLLLIWLYTEPQIRLA